MGSGICTPKPSTIIVPRATEISELYRACEAGDVEATRQILRTIPFAQANCLESNGSTALHIASSLGHADVVRLLIEEFGVSSHRQNREGLTAYEVAANAEIKKIFQRPKSNDRFSTSAASFVQSLFKKFFQGQPVAPGPWVEGTAGSHNVKLLEGQMMMDKTMNNNPTLEFGTNLARRPVITLFNAIGPDQNSAEKQVKPLRNFVDAFVTPTHSEYQKACQCLSDFEKTKRVEPLLRLYSLETPFYSKMGSPELCHHLLAPLKRNLLALKGRHFQGTSYRGLTMKEEDLADYQWALDHVESVLTMQSFASTTLDIQMALFYTQLRASDDKITVLMTYVFPELCDTAIILYKVSDTLPCISNYEDEQEILLFPDSMFHVTKIDTTTDPTLVHIHLENVMPKVHIEAEVLEVAKTQAIKTFVPGLFQGLVYRAVS